MVKPTVRARCGEGRMFGETVRAHRARLGITQEELASSTGLGVRTIRGIETGRIVNPRPGTVRLLADAFGLSGADRDGFHQAVQPGDTADRQRPVPAQLPADLRGFTGRTEQLAQLDALLCGDDRPTSVVISAVSGTAGVGKTSLAVHWAHQVRHRFPDGQLYVNLRGYDPDQPMTPADALARFLTALGVASKDIPLDTDERAASYRTVIADRRIMIVLDNAATVGQVRPLLPGTPTCVVVVTSRDSLAALVALHGAHRLDLDLLPPNDALALLRRLIGPRVEADPRAAATLVTLCARLPLGLVVAGELAVSHPATPLAELATELEDQQRRLDLLDAGGDPHAAVRTVFSWSLKHLPPDTARTFGLLGLHPGPDLDVYAAAALADTSPLQASRVLDQLARVHLIHPTAAGRWGMHDLLRAYAFGLAATGWAPDSPRSALDRLFDYYVAVAGAAMNALHPAETNYRPRVPRPKTATPTFPRDDPESARIWLDTERPTLTSVAAHTAVHGWPTRTVQLSNTLYRYLAGGHYTDALAIHTYARDAARRAGDPTGEGHALLSLGVTYMQMGRHGPAAEHLQQALALYRQTNDPIGEARALGNLGLVEGRVGRYQSAIERLQQALTVCRQAGDQVTEAGILGNLGSTEEWLGRYQTAADHHKQALAVFRQLGNRSGEAHTLADLSIVEERQGRPGPAADHLQQALTIFHQLGNRSGEAWTLDGLGTLHTRLGRPTLSSDQHLLALTLFHEIGEPDGEASALNGLGEAAHAAGQPADAVAHHTAALATATATGAAAQQARAYSGLSHAHHTLGDTTRAHTYREQATAIYADLGSPQR
jgi:tetratricopeptide (TPR) repeat protein/transcriptional regulator with XRE-family HTH domain